MNEEPALKALTKRKVPSAGAAETATADKSLSAISGAHPAARKMIH
jgi:hypothetical protein